MEVENEQPEPNREIHQEDLKLDIDKIDDVEESFF